MKYVYTNITPVRVTIGETDHNLIAGQPYDLPEGNAYVQCLVDQGHLVPEEPKQSDKNNKKS